MPCHRCCGGLCAVLAWTQLFTVGPLGQGAPSSCHPSVHPAQLLFFKATSAGCDVCLRPPPLLLPASSWTHCWHCQPQIVQLLLQGPQQALVRGRLVAAALAQHRHDLLHAPQDTKLRPFLCCNTCSKRFLLLLLLLVQGYRSSTVLCAPPLPRQQSSPGARRGLAAGCPAPSRSRRPGGRLDKLQRSLLWTLRLHIRLHKCAPMLAVAAARPCPHCCHSPWKYRDRMAGSLNCSTGMLCCN